LTFIIRIYHDARSSECQILCYTVLNILYDEMFELCKRYNVRKRIIIIIINL